MPTSSTRILAFSGSARRESFNRKLLHAVVARVRATGAEVKVVDLRELALPLYDGDLEDEHGMPAGAQKLVELITAHDALLIASPEYNSQITPLLKNAIDWATRADENPLAGKVAAVVSASPGNFGAIRSMTLARQLLTHLGCHVIPAQCILPKAAEAFDENGALKDERSRKNAAGVAEELVAVASRLRLAS
jgi:chromate reductase, NAD(P)H dehydrogenase (quinone)